MLRLPQSEDAEDFSSDVASTSFETSVGPSRSHRTSKTTRWRPFVYIAVLLIIIIFIIRAFRSSGNTFYEGHTFGDSGPAILRQASKVRAPNFHKTNPRGDYRNRVLCKLLGNGKCQSKYIADVIDLVWVLGPLYCFDKDSDWKLFEMHGYFKGYMESYGLNFITIEAIRFPGDEHLRPWSKECREYTATIPGNEPYDIQTHYYNVSFIRENLLNVAIRKLEQQKPWQYAFWIDAHHMFYNNYWWEESIHKLEKFNSVQLVETVQYVGYDNVTKYPFKTLGIIKASLLSDFPFNYTIFFGNAFGIRRDIYHAIGTIYDECIATSCDCAYTLASFPDGVGFPPLYPVYYKNFEPWINHTKSVFQGKRAFVTGNALHLPHGHGFPYGEVQDSVVKNNYNTTLHIARDENFTFIITNSTISAELDEIILTSKREHPTSRSW